MRFHKTILPMGESAVDRHNSFLRADEFLFDRHVCHVIGTAAAIGIGVASAVGGVASGALGAHAAGHAADVASQGQIDAAKISAASQEKMYNQTRADQLPYLTGGAGALGRLDYLLGLPGPQTSTQGAYGAGFGPQGTAYLPGTGGVPAGGYGAASASGAMPVRSGFKQTDPYGDGRGNYLLDDRASAVYGRNKNGAAPAAQPQVPGVVDPSYGSLMHDFSSQDFQQDPGYQFRLSEGQKALDRSAAARGVLGSGSYLKDLTNYNQGAASQEYQDAYNRYQNNRTTKYNFLSNAAGGGQIAANNLSSVGAQYGQNIGNALYSGYSNAANARASGYIGAAGAWNDAIGGVANAGIDSYLATQRRI